MKIFYYYISKHLILRYYYEDILLLYFQAPESHHDDDGEDGDKAVIIFVEVTSKDGDQDYVDGVDGVDHGEGSKSDDEGVGWVMVDDGGTPWLDNQLKISMCENCQTIEKLKKLNLPQPHCRISPPTAGKHLPLTQPSLITVLGNPILSKSMYIYIIWK